MGGKWAHCSEATSMFRKEKRSNHHISWLHLNYQPGTKCQLRVSYMSSPGYITGRIALNQVLGHLSSHYVPPLGSLWHQVNHFKIDEPLSSFITCLTGNSNPIIRIRNNNNSHWYYDLTFETLSHNNPWGGQSSCNYHQLKVRNPSSGKWSNSHKATQMESGGCGSEHPALCRMRSRGFFRAAGLRLETSSPLRVLDAQGLLVLQAALKTLEILGRLLAGFLVQRLGQGVFSEQLLCRVHRLLCICCSRLHLSATWSLAVFL